MNDLQVPRAQEITRLHNEIVGSLRQSLEKAIRIGELLAEQKASMEHGQFGAWVTANLPFTDRTARNYMRCHRERDRLKTETVSDLKSAYLLLREPEPEEQPEIAGEEFGLGEQYRKELKVKVDAALRDLDRIPDPVTRVTVCKSIRDDLLSLAQDAAKVVLDAEAKEESILDIPADELREIIHNINKGIGRRNYAVSLDTKWWKWGNDGSMTEAEIESYPLAFNIMKHDCYFRHVAYYRGIYDLPVRVRRYLENIDPGTSLREKPKEMCREFCPFTHKKAWKGSVVEHWESHAT